MVTITGYRTRYGVGGDKKIYFQVEGGVKTTVSQKTALKASVFAAVDEEVAKAMIGHQLPGTIKQLQVEPYQIVNDETGEVRVYNHRSEYVPDELMELAWTKLLKCNGGRVPPFFFLTQSFYGTKTSQ